MRYYTEDDEVAVLKFSLVRSFKFGSPNDEVLAGHPLKKYGLDYYWVHKVEDSPWILELEKQNSAYPRHEREKYISSSEYYIFAFQDSTLECVAIVGEFWKPEIKILTVIEAKKEWQAFIEKISWNI